MRSRQPNPRRPESPAPTPWQKLREGLEKYEFPLLLTAEWGQPDRLLKLLDSAGTSQARKLKIISLLGEMQADEALPRLKQALQDRDLAKEQALAAMGNLGRERAFPCWSIS